MVTQAQQLKKTRARAKSRYGVQLQEKQNLKEIFGIREEQLRRYFREAHSSKGETGPTLVTLLERRLDNAVYRAGFAETRPQARQMATHRLFMVNGRSVDIPSLLLRPGDVVSIREGKRSKALFSNFQKRLQNARPPSWVEIDPATYSFRITGSPTMEEAALGVDVQAVVELFAR